MVSINSLQKEAPPPDGGVQSILDPWRIPSVTVCPFKGGLGSSLWGIWDKKIKANPRKPHLKTQWCRLSRSCSTGILPIPAALRDVGWECGITFGKREWGGDSDNSWFWSSRIPPGAALPLPPSSPCGFWVGSSGSCCIHVGSAHPCDKSISHGSGGG